MVIGRGSFVPSPTLGADPKGCGSTTGSTGPCDSVFSWRTEDVFDLDFYGRSRVGPDALLGGPDGGPLDDEGRGRPYRDPV